MYMYMCVYVCVYIYIYIYIYICIGVLGVEQIRLQNNAGRGEGLNGISSTIKHYW